MKRCHQCRSDQLFHDRHSGDVVCGACGLVLSERIADESQDRKISKDPTRPQTSRHEKTLLLSELFSIKKKNKTQKKIVDIYYRIRSYAERLHIYDKISAMLNMSIHKLLRYKTLTLVDEQAFAMALLYLICMDMGLAFVRQDFSIDQAILTPMISKAVDIYRGDFSVSKNYYTNLLHRFCNELGVPYRHIHDLQIKLEHTISDPASHMSPLTAIGVTIARYNPSLPIEKISKTTHVTVNTLKKHLRTTVVAVN